MRAKVVSIESGSNHADGRRRVLLQFGLAVGLYDTLRLPEGALGLANVTLDDEINVEFRLIPSPIPIPIDAPLAQAIRHDAQQAKDAPREDEEPIY